MKANNTHVRSRANSIGLQALKVSEVKLIVDQNRKNKFMPKKIQKKNTIKNIEGIIEERTKNIRNINEMSIENFRNKIFNKRKDKNIYDNPFEDIIQFNSTDIKNNISEKINHMVKYGSPILWKRNSKKKEIEKIQKSTYPSAEYKTDKTNENNISILSNRDSFSINKLLYWKNSSNKIERNDNEYSVMKDEVVFTNPNMNIEENENYYNSNKCDIDKHAYKLLKDELNHENVLSSKFNQIDENNIYLHNINTSIAYSREMNNNHLKNSIYSPKFAKESKDLKFDCTLNSFKDLKNIHESVILYGEYQENIMTTTVNDIKFLDLINRNKSYISELIQLTENLPAIHDNNINEIINETIEHLISGDEEKVKLIKNDGKFPLISDTTLHKSFSDKNLLIRPSNIQNISNRLNKKKLSFLLNNINTNKNSDINSLSCVNYENVSYSAVNLNKTFKKIKGLNHSGRKLKVKFEEQDTLKDEEMKKNDTFGFKINWKKAEIIQQNKECNVYKIFDINNSNTLLAKKYKINLKRKYSLNTFYIQGHQKTQGVSKSTNFDNLENNISISNNINNTNFNQYSDSSNNKSNHSTNYIHKSISEFESLKKHEHKNIVKFIDYEIIDNDCFLYFEYIPGKSLRNVLDTYGNLTENIIKKYLKNIIEAIVYLIKKEIKLKNLKSSNILLELNGNIKLTDYLDYKSIIEFHEIYENSDLKNLRYSDKFLKYPHPWMMSESNLNNDLYPKTINEMDYMIKINNFVNLSFLSFLMIEMLTGPNIEFLNKSFRGYLDGDYFNENISTKNFFFPCEVSENFKDLFYIFSNKNIQIRRVEEMLNHKFFSQS